MVSFGSASERGNRELRQANEILKKGETLSAIGSRSAELFATGSRTMARGERLHLCADLVGGSLHSPSPLGLNQWRLQWLDDRCLRAADHWLARVLIHDDQVRPRRPGSGNLAKENTE